MPLDETPRQKKHASKPVSSSSISAYADKSMRTISFNFGSRTPVAARPMVTATLTSGSRRHSRKTPWPTIPVAPNTSILIDSSLLNASIIRRVLRLDCWILVMCAEQSSGREYWLFSREPAYALRRPGRVGTPQLRMQRRQHRRRASLFSRLRRVACWLQSI